MRRWHVIQSKPHQEERVLSQLQEQLQLDVYFPRIEVVTARKTGKVKIVKSLFPNYLFANLVLPDEWKLITYTRGVSQILGGWKEPRPIEEAVITAIREQENKKDRLIHYYRFNPQESVYIRSGPMKDLYGIFERYVDDRGRVRILLSLIGYQASVELEAEQITKA